MNQANRKMSQGSLGSGIQGMDGRGGGMGRDYQSDRQSTGSRANSSVGNVSSVGSMNISQAGYGSASDKGGKMPAD